MMNFIFTEYGVSIRRDASDKRIPKESTLVHRALAELNRGDFRRPWVRCWPDRHGLTSCRTGFRNRLSGVIYWHGDYQVEDAAQVFNERGGVFFHAG
jgi:hypothetical protein